jgi:protocatechuate 3,4-dioxygenase beta subunit
MIVSRRGAITGIGAALLSGHAAAAALRATPQEMMGPFYPLHPLAEDDADLAHLAARFAPARGQLIEVYGRVLRTDGSPVAGASVALWQANAAGRYMHPADRNVAAPLDPGFQGFGRIVTGRGGDYRFVTVKPGPYPAPNGTIRAPHLHFDADGRDCRLVTQMYFPGEPLNETDFLRSTLAARRFDPATVTAERADAQVEGALAYRWDMVLVEGAV